jgi:arsenite methyltransferase
VSGISYSEEAAQTLMAIYSTPDAVAQREATLQRLALKIGDRVIDVGCGPGFLCESMAAEVTAAGQVLGVDLSQDLVRFAKKRKSRSWIDYRVGDAVELDVPSGAFDVAVSTQVIEYVPDLDAAIREFYRVLRRGGRGLVVDTDWDTVVWHANDPARMARILAAWEDHCAHPRLPRTLAPRLRARGFVVDGVEAYSIVNIAHDPNTYSHGIARLIVEFLEKKNFDSSVLADWLADLADMGQRGTYFFSINRYFFAVTKPGGPR